MVTHEKFLSTVILNLHWDLYIGICIYTLKKKILKIDSYHFYLKHSYSVILGCDFIKVIFLSSL